VSNSSTTTASQSAQSKPTAPDAVGSRVLGWSAFAAIAVSLAIMVAVGLLRKTWMPPALPVPSGPSFELGVHVDPRDIYWTMWVAAGLAAAGVIAGLVAVRRGQPVPIRALLVVAGLAAAVLTFVPPVGTTDPLDYAVYGHIVAIGHDPYTMTPYQFRLLTHTVGVPVDWEHTISVYGPLATGEQYLAARLGGASLASTIFWLKLANTAAYAALAFVAHRVFRNDRAARVRAHLLWTVNPLIIWAAIAASHIDVLAAALGVAGILILDRRGADRPIAAALAAGLFIGAACDIKADFALYGLAVIWCVWRRPRELAAAAAGALIVLVPSYAAAGESAIKALSVRASTGLGWGFYKFLFYHLHISLNAVVPVALVLLIPVIWLSLTRLPEGYGNRPAVRAALALSMAWLLVWPHQFSWYSIMGICVLMLFPASRLDWLAVAWMAALTLANMPGLGVDQNQLLGSVMEQIEGDLVQKLEPVVMFVALIAFVVWCLNRRWNSAGAELSADWPPAQPAGPATS
jgi:hypothetical protein